MNVPISTVETKGVYSNLKGFTLIEVMVVIIVLGILAAISVPAFQDTILTTKIRSYANSFISSTRLARAEAIKRNTPVSLCVSSADGASCATGGWEQGWIIITGTTVIQRQQAVTTGYKITESSGLTSLTFQPTGIGATQSTFTICRATPSVGNQERVVTISATGKSTITKTTNGSCS